MSSGTSEDYAAGDTSDVIFEGKPSCLGGCTHYLNKYHWRITNNYIEREYGICCKSIDNLQLLRVKDVSFSETCCCATCGVITIISSDTTCPELRLEGLPNGKDIFHKIRDAVAAIHKSAKLELDG